MCDHSIDYGIIVKYLKISTNVIYSNQNNLRTSNKGSCL